MPFLYTPLDDPAEQIRLVLLRPGDWDDDLRVTFHTRSSAQYKHKYREHEKESKETSSQSYEALSYAWGSPEHASAIFVGIDGNKDAQTIPIAQNLDVALRHLRSASETLLLWIDALCIDQQSISEKNVQVAMMSRIYKAASKTIVWLGPADDDSDTALDYLHYLHERVDHDVQVGIATPSQGCPEHERHIADRSRPMAHKEETVRSMLSLFGRPYFTRTWVRQEISSSVNPVIHCGSKEMSWQVFYAMIWFIETKPCTIAPENHTVLLGDFVNSRENILRLCDAVRYRTHIPTMRLDVGKTYCQDPRDKIYASLGKVKHPAFSTELKTDYSRPVEDLYADVARRVIMENRDLSILQSCVLSTRKLQIPSWTPDWSTPLPYGKIRSWAWSACAWITGQFILSPSELCITAKGFCVSSIANVFEVQTGSIETWSKTLDMLRKFKHRHWGPDLEVSKRYPDSEWAELVCLTLFDARIADYFYPPRDDCQTLQECATFLRTIWSTDLTWDEYDDDTQGELQRFVMNCTYDFQGMQFFETYNGIIGHSFPGVREGDEICVLLGCPTPIILRPSTPGKDSASRTYEVVSDCHIPGVMQGEMIYGSGMPGHYQPALKPQNTNGWMLDRKKNELKPSASTLLAEVGIEIVGDETHSLDVLPETLIAAGIRLIDFTLV